MPAGQALAPAVGEPHRERKTTHLPDNTTRHAMATGASG